MVDGDAVDCDKCALGPSPKRACVIEDVFECGWVGVVVAGGWDLRKAIWSLDVEAEVVELSELRY